MSADLDAVRRAIREAVAGLENQTERAAFENAGALIELLTNEAIAVGKLRANSAAQLREREHLSLAGLADALGISKTRADQLVRLSRS